MYRKSTTASFHKRARSRGQAGTSLRSSRCSLLCSCLHYSLGLLGSRLPSSSPTLPQSLHDRLPTSSTELALLRSSSLRRCSFAFPQRCPPFPLCSRNLSSCRCTENSLRWSHNLIC